MRRTTLLALTLLALSSALRAQNALLPAQRDGSQPNRLAELSLEQLGNTEVTSTTKEPEQIWKTSAAVYVITQDDIHRSGVTNLPDALRLAPGVEVAQIDSNKWSIGIRGFENRLSRSVLVLIDGRSVYTPLFAGVYWEVQDTLLEDVERIEVIRGPGGTIWGANAVNGVINIITRNSKDTHGLLASAGGGNVDQGFVSARLGAGNDRLSYRAYGKGTSIGPQFHQDGLNFDRWGMGQGGFRVDWAPTERDAVTVQGDAYGSVDGEYGEVATFSPPANNFVQANGYFFGQNVTGHWRHQLSSGSDFQLQAYYDRTDRHDFDYRETRNTFDIDFIHHWNLRRNNLIWGSGARISPSRFIQTVPSVRFSSKHEVYNIYSLFVQDGIALVPNKLTFTVGTKIEYNTYSGWDVQPSGRLLWTPREHETFWAAVTRAVRTPSRVEEDLRLSVLGNPSPPTFLRLVGNGIFSSEQLLGYEFGYRQAFSRKTFISLSAFYNRYDDLLSAETGTPFLESNPAPPHVVLPIFERNGIRGDTRGIEFAPEWQPWSWWRIRGSYSYVHLSMRDKVGSTDATTVGQLEGDSPQHNARVQSSFDLPRHFQFDVDYRYVSSLPDQHVSSYSTADARIGWHFGRFAEFSLVGQNLFQPQHFEYGGDPGPLVGIKRSVYGKLTLYESR
jgi:iron complex outermembrane receptor protein